VEWVCEAEFYTVQPSFSVPSIEYTLENLKHHCRFCVMVIYARGGNACSFGSEIFIFCAGNFEKCVGGTEKE
jgi:hypothetical protein